MEICGLGPLTKNGNDILVAGTQTGDANTYNAMWGDSSGNSKGGADTFVFHDTGAAKVGTQNYIMDFDPTEHDHIQFIGVDGVTSFADLTFDTTTSGTITHAGADTVTLVGYTGALHASDFIL